MDERSDGELLTGCRVDPEAFGVFYRRHRGAVLRFLLERTRRADLAADMCAETFARALEQADRFDSQRAPARVWLFVIASSVLIDSVRRRQVEDRARRRLGMPARELSDADLERVEELVAAEQGPDVAELVAGLPPFQREALLARIVDERPYAEIAAEMRVSEAVVRQRVRRGLTALRAQVGEGAA